MPIATSAIIGGIVTYLGTQLSQNKSISGFISEFTGATVEWLKPLFLKEDGTEKEVIKQLVENPKSKARHKAVESLFDIELEDTPGSEKHLKAMWEKITETEEGKQVQNTIINSTNVIIGDVGRDANQGNTSNSKD